MPDEEKPYGEMSREERVTGKPPAGSAEAVELDKDSREYRASHPESKDNANANG